MADLIYEDAVAEAMMDAVVTAIGASGCLVLYEGVEGTDPQTIPAGVELCIINLAATPFGAAATQGSAPSETARTTLQTVSDTVPSFAGGPTKVAGSFAIFKNQTTRTAANLIVKGDISTVAAATGALQLDNTTLTDAGGAVNMDEANSYLELPLNNNY